MLVKRKQECRFLLLFLVLFSYLKIKALLNLVTELLAISGGTGESEGSVINRQTALYSLKLLTRLLAKEHPDEFKEVLELIFFYICE